ncbi:MAG: carbohydrate ABC transporter permease [Provencibacterium sp.]|jgi:putative aldouronate transport system permease protein|nr:carbohydrate ABC transporter permease [Provencibacterium sp.]
MKIKKTAAEKAFDIANALFMTLLMIIMLYPLWFVAVASVSNPNQFIQHKGILLLPTGLSGAAYKAILDYKMLFISYGNTIGYVLIGTTLNLFMTMLGAYGLSRRNVLLRDPIMMLVTFTMFFNGGLIPNYLLVKSLGIYNTRAALILPGAISVMNLIIMRSSFQAVPETLEESARIDGANDFTILWKVILPLCKPVMAVMVLYYGVSHWNAWFNAMIYLRNRELYPLQLILREILISNSTESLALGNDSEQIAETIKYATIMVATVPILCVYPFLQKYFVKGVMVGAIKG